MILDNKTSQPYYEVSWEKLLNAQVSVTTSEVFKDFKKKIQSQRFQKLWNVSQAKKKQPTVRLLLLLR